MRSVVTSTSAKHTILVIDVQQNIKNSEPIRKIACVKVTVFLLTEEERTYAIEPLSTCPAMRELEVMMR